MTSSCLTPWNPVWPISLQCDYEPCSSFFETLINHCTRFTDISKHIFYDHQNASYRIHSLFIVLMHLIYVRCACKTPYCTKTPFKGSRLGPRSYLPNKYFVAILKLSLHFLQVFWLGSKIKLSPSRIWT